MTLAEQLEASIAHVNAQKAAATSKESLQVENAARLFVMPPPSPSLPERLSPSQVNTFAACQYKWYCSKILQLDEPRGSALGIGTAVDHAITENFRQKIETREDLPPDGAVALAINSWADQLDEGLVLQPDENRHELCDTAETLVRMFMDRAAPAIDPAGVQVHVEGEIGGVPTHGYIDILTTDGRVIDLKTAARKPAGITPAHRLQLATYAMLAPQASGEAQLITLTKTKTAGMYSDTLQILPRDRKLAESMYSIARDQMRSGIYAPNRSAFLCSRRHCGFWSRCEAEFGGEVSK